MVKSYTLALTGWRNTTWLHAMWSQTLQWNSAIGRYVDLNTLKPRQYGRHFPDDLFKCIFLNENVWISLTISLKFVPKVPINNIPTLVQIMAWRRPGDKPLSEPMMVGLPTHIGVTRLQCINILSPAENVLHVTDGIFIFVCYVKTAVFISHCNLFLWAKLKYHHCSS